MPELKQKPLITNNIHILRAEIRISQEKLAEHLGVTRATVNALERGSYNPSLELAFKISIFFGRSIEEIFKFEELNVKN